MVAVDDPDPPQEATIETESMGVLRAHTVVVQRLANELFHIEELHLRVQQGCELDATQREKLGREDELLSALEAALAVAAAAVPQPIRTESPQRVRIRAWARLCWDCGVEACQQNPLTVIVIQAQNCLHSLLVDLVEDEKVHFHSLTVNSM